MRRTAMLAVVASLFVGMLAAPAVAHRPLRFVEEEMSYGYFYGTFGQNPNIVLLAGGTAEDFCPEGFDGSPGMTTSRTFVRQDGSVDVKVNDRRQPIHLYKTGPLDAMAWITEVCIDINDGDPAPEPFASGRAKLKVRDSYLFDGGPPERLFNSVNGRATGTDGTRYKVRAAANIPFENGAPVGTPPDWLSFKLKEIGH
ncbi:MAG: hypothetical protein BMS9Abin17_0207 [Acidimicrobiia bacterium]|nr:MAG: hypothetical protein BMS9Abin17_0207 [Acidimicrobiia bacterium]